MRSYRDPGARSIRAARILPALLAVLCVRLLSAGTPEVDDTPGSPGEWGFRPTGETAVTPPGFSWRPQKNARSYSLEASRDGTFAMVDYEAAGLRFNVHCPPRKLTAGEWAWRFRFTDREGKVSGWSRTRHFTVPEGVVEFPLPPREELLARIPRRHPRLFLRPEDLPRLRDLARGKLAGVYRALVRKCDRLRRDPPPTAEPPKYPPGVKRKDERWREIWWGNRRYTVRVLDGAATLAFTWLLDGNEDYGQLARKLLLAAAEWDPQGSTGYRYNDEAGMPYAYYFARTYTFVHPLLSEVEREKCREVMRIRGEEMYRHLHPRHLWRPYSSHSNRAWHFLGEVGIAFHDEIDAARDWVWFALNVFRNVYPVWSDADGGWHEGISYWRSYIGRFTWWADVMKAAVGIDAYQKPYFSQAGYWPLYLQPPGTQVGGFGDLAFWSRASRNGELMAILAAQAGNRYWRWYAEAVGYSPHPDTYIDFVRGSLPEVEAKPPVDLHPSRVFRGVGQAVLNTDLIAAAQNISVIFKASPFGTQSHGHEAQNTFQLYAFGTPLLTRTGRRDIHGSRHHVQWMWETKSDNSVLVDGEGQEKHSAAATARITGFEPGRSIDIVAGDAAPAYGGRLARFTRAIVFIKPGAIVVFDRLEAREPATFQWLLHAPVEFRIEGQEAITVENGEASCRVALLAPDGLDLDASDRFDPPPRPRVKLRQFHLTAAAAEVARERHFITVIHPYRTGTEPPEPAALRRIEGGFLVELSLRDGSALVLLRTEAGATLRAGPESSAADIHVARRDAAGKVIERAALGGAPE